MSSEDMTPILPPHLKIKAKSKSSKSESEDDASPDEDFYGPKPPPKPSTLPQTSISNEAKYVGPTLPPAHILSKLQESAPEPDSYLSSSEDDDMIGPLPGGSNFELEKRAIELKMSKISGESSTSNTETSGREEWMLELPKINSVAGMGLAARQFRANDRPDFSDRTSWTDTPEEREKKTKGPTDKEIEKQKERETRARLIAMRDEEQERMVKKHKKKHKRDKSLMEIHEKKLKKKKKVKHKMQIGSMK